MNDPNTYPPGWDGERVRRLIDHYEQQTEEEQAAEDDAVWEDTTQTVMLIPNELVPSVRELLSKHTAR
jgi:hypothetical protein